MHEARTIVERTLVPHREFEETSRRLEQCFQYATGTTEPICLAIVGESRTGKSRVLEECFNRHPRHRTVNGLITPILRITAPSKPSVNGLVEIMLSALGDPLFDKGTENGKTIRLRQLIKESGTILVMIDEFQHFVEKSSLIVIHQVADWLKVLVDQCRVALVVAGLTTCQAVLEQNEQLAGRFLAPAFMTRFDWLNTEHREEFLAILGAFHESLSLHFDLPFLDSKELGFRCYCATGGIIGYLTKFLRLATWNALDAGKKTIDLKALAIANQNAIWAKNGLVGTPNPFTSDFFASPNRDLIARIKKIGMPTEPPIRHRRILPERQGKLSVSDILSAT